MAREEQLIQTFVTLADTLVEGYDVIDFLQTLAEGCVELLDVSAAGVMLADANGALRHAACSDEQMRLVELFELQLEQGPCLDAYRSRELVTSATIDDIRRRWPDFAPKAEASGYTAVAAVPLRLRAMIIGALNLFSVGSGEMGGDDIAVAQAMADIATIGILQERAVHDSQSVTAQLQGALESRVVIEQAKGIISEQADCSVDDAFQRIRAFARNHGRRLSETARQIIDGSLRGFDLIQPAQETSARDA